MRHLLAFLLVLSLVAPAWADEKPKPNTLTPKEIAEGWILLFDGETTFGWKFFNDSPWTIADGMLAPRAGKTGILVTTTAFNKYEFRLEYQAKKNVFLPQVVVSRQMEVIPKKVKGGEMLSLPPGEDVLALKRFGTGWHQLHMTVEGTMIVAKSIESAEGKTWFNGTPSIPPHGASHIALIGDGFVVRNIKLKPLGTKPLFNGKDLSGWKKFEGDPKRAKSQFSVTKEGWLSIKNGPGDLQTTGQWSDFVLQLDCRTNGDDLNSGVFFRCIPGEYQNGYEAQIQNRKAKEPKKYTIQEFDPKTHELKGKQTIENWSQDYGTGAIYRRIPARRSVAKDREWFTMTVIAHGRHIATWVNGIQATDWTDNRPENENARNGCRLKKGPISLQGHDSTTDLSFRNIRLADLTEKK